jgi:hypothetical protein
MSDYQESSWLRIPFARDVLAIGAILALAPFVIALYIYSLGLTNGAMILGGLWMAVYLALAIWLHRKSYIRLFVSLGCALLTIAVFGFSFLN